MPGQWKRGLAFALCIVLCSCGSPAEQLPVDDLMESGEMAIEPQVPTPTEAGPEKEEEEPFVPGLSPEIAQALEETNIGYLGVFGQGYFVYRDKSSGRYGYIDMRGEVYLEPMFTEATSFRDDMAVVKTGVGYGVLGIDGSYLLGPDLPYQELRPFSDRLAAFMQDERWGYIDLEGNQVIEPRYWGAMDFSEGLAVVGYAPDGGVWHLGEVIDRDGNTVFALQDVSDDGDYQYHEGLIFVRHHFPYTSFHRWGTYYDRTGNKILPRTVGRAPSFYNGVAFVSRLYERPASSGLGGQGSYDIMLPDGSFLYQQEEALPGILSDHGYLTDGWLPLPDAENKVEYFREGEHYPWKVVMPHTYINLQLEDLGIVNYAPHSYYFSEGLVYVVDEHGKQGYMDTKGNLVIDLAEVERQLGGALLTERYGLCFANGYASVYTAGKCALIDKTGSLVFVLDDGEAEIYAVFADGDDVAVLIKNRIIDKNQRIVFTCYRMMGLDGSLRFASAEAYETSQNNIYYVPNPYEPYYAEYHA